MEWEYSLTCRNNLIRVVNVTYFHFFTLFKQSCSVQQNSHLNSREVRCRWSRPLGALELLESHMKCWIYNGLTHSLSKTLFFGRNRAGFVQSRLWCWYHRTSFWRGSYHCGVGLSHMNLPALSDPRCFSSPYHTIKLHWWYNRGSLISMCFWSLSPPLWLFLRLNRKSIQCCWKGPGELGCAYWSPL